MFYRAIQNSINTSHSNIRPENFCLKNWDNLSRTNLVISSSDLRKIIRARSNQNKLLFIGLNESSHQEMFNQSICFEKF